ncbi:MAG: hypothetical protein COB67_09560 [SAR324 cluster bacterium]|uniref:Calcineurin-like phosphoesterase domain-containing protein n=1 Tax=SAR324 cluster bacterium TaxID=2024889 RepID=A0A2A4T088_9DELT|nr:MAG: hypothetical protein COB67_09560 [SAR324 cluster bacterium]
MIGSVPEKIHIESNNQFTASFVYMRTIQRITIIADSHLGAKKGDVDQMIRFIRSLNPQEDELLFLGDLFHIWAGPEKYHTPEVTSFLKALQCFREAEGRVHLNVGNRDIFFPERLEGDSRQKLPFTSVTREFISFELQGKKLMAIHGDTVNSQDLKYLRWRKLVRSPWFRAAFNLAPNAWVKKTMFDLEKKLKQTNVDFRQAFPLEEWKKFLQRVNEQYTPDLLLIGHFHPHDPIITSHEKMKGIVIPDWYRDRSYLTINQNLEYQHHKFEA